MSSRNVFASSVVACLLAIGSGGLAPVANAAPAGQSFLNPGASVGTNLIEIKRHGHSRRIYPIVPYIAYDYPYYYSRGYYPTHIGPGYVYNNSYGSGYYDDDAADEAVPYSAEERCARRFKSFDWDTGRYTTYGGHTKLCPYLR